MFGYGPEGDNNMNNVVVHDNTMNFLSTNPGVNCCGAATDLSIGGGGAQDPSGTGFWSNHYHLVGGNPSADQHWQWFTGSPQTFASWQASPAYCDGSGNCTLPNPDTAASGGAGTIDTSAAYQGTGGTHVACSSAGIGPGGVPVGAAAQ